MLLEFRASLPLPDNFSSGLNLSVPHHPVVLTVLIVASCQVLFLVEIIEACGFNQQPLRLGILYRVSSPFAVRS